MLRCNPETRAKSAREMGCRRRIRFRTTPRLMSRAVSLEATVTSRFARSHLCIGEFNSAHLIFDPNYMKSQIIRIHHEPGQHPRNLRLKKALRTIKFAARTISVVFPRCQEQAFGANRLPLDSLFLRTNSSRVRMIGRLWRKTSCFIALRIHSSPSRGYRDLE